jgi:hypothetical protein
MSARTWKRAYVGNSRKGKNKTNVQTVLRLISFLDAFASNNFDDYSRFDRMAREGDMDSRVSAEWTATKPLLDEISAHLKGLPRLKLLLRIQLLSRVSSILLILAAVPFFILQPLAFTIVSIVGLILLYAGIIMLLVPTLVGRRISRVLSDYFSSHDEQLRLPKTQLRSHVQRLIQIARRIAIEQKIPSDKVALALYTTDYDGITSPQKGPLSKKYWVSLNLETRTGRPDRSNLR